MIRPMTANISNPKSKLRNKKKIIGSTRDRIRQVYHQVNLIRLMKVIIKERDSTKRRDTVKISGALSNYAKS